ncbi:MAG TPA: hypothetical protein VK250_06665 [Nitrososphaeraceae archaeon]|nr:hypothetical protein [Nitrososphaeraceae archaeon]
MSHGIFKEIERLIEFIPIEVDISGIGELPPNTSIDSKYNFTDKDGIATRLGILDVGSNTISLRDIIKLLNKFLKDSGIEELVENPRRYREIQKNSSGVPLKNLLFDFCLSALAGDTFDAKLFLTHSFHLIGLRRNLVTLLSSIVFEPSIINNDNDVRRLLTLLAMISEPNNIDVYFDINKDGFNIRYDAYLKEIRRISNDSLKDSNILQISQAKKT